MSPICNELRKEFQQKLFISVFVCPSIIPTLQCVFNSPGFTLSPLMVIPLVHVRICGKVLVSLACFLEDITATDEFYRRPWNWRAAVFIIKIID
jgi:hypothetical protein